MKAFFYLIVANVAILLFTPQITMAANNDSSLVIHFGEALAPNNFRLNINTFDIGYDGKSGGLYAGSRLGKNGFYGGVGLWASSDSLGLYGVIGKEWKFFKVLLTSFEFYSIGNSAGNTYAVAHLGVGIAW